MSDTQFRDAIKTLLAALGSNDAAQRQEAREKIRDTLAANRKSWNDLIAILRFGGQHGEKLKKLFAMLGQDNDGEFDNARQKVSDLLAGGKRTWKAFVDSPFSASSHSWSDWHDDAASRAAINPLDLVHHLLQRYVDLTPRLGFCRNFPVPRVGIPVRARRFPVISKKFPVPLRREFDPEVIESTQVLAIAVSSPKCNSAA